MTRRQALVIAAIAATLLIVTFVAFLPVMYCADRGACYDERRDCEAGGSLCHWYTARQVWCFRRAGAAAAACYHGEEACRSALHWLVERQGGEATACAHP
jgi:hypothetical protein